MAGTNEIEQRQYQAFVADRVHLYVSGLLSDYPGLAQNVKYDGHFEPQIKAMVMQIKSWCVAGRIPSDEVTREIKWPDGPWQAFKEKYFPKWVLDRWPVRHKIQTVVVTTNHYFVCPHLVTSSQDRHIQFMATGTAIAGRIRKDGDPF